MKLNYDCIRDTLLCIESIDTIIEDESGEIFCQEITLNDLVDAMKKKKKKYSKKEIYYTLIMLRQAGYIDISEDWADDSLNNCCVNSLTFTGHKFLDTIRDNKVWHFTKGILSKFASVSVPMIENIASQVITNLVNQYILQNPYGTI